tara:strand:+ start:933 stop:1130 length:198 start_codon:yes stop_codon:yes gene_type:complete
MSVDNVGGTNYPKGSGYCGKRGGNHNINTGGWFCIDLEQRPFLLTRRLKKAHLIKNGYTCIQDEI